MFSLQTPARSSALLPITFQSFGLLVNLPIPPNTIKRCITEHLNTPVAASWGSRFNISFTTRRCLRRKCCQSIPITREYSGPCRASRCCRTLVNLVHVPYRGGGPAMTDLLGDCSIACSLPVSRLLGRAEVSGQMGGAHVVGGQRFDPQLPLDCSRFALCPGEVCHG